MNNFSRTIVLGIFLLAVKSYASFELAVLIALTWIVVELMEINNKIKKQ